MDIELNGGGKVAFGAPQQRWHSLSGDESILQSARFAGQEMMVITDDAGGFELHYLNFKAGGFPTMTAAKQAAPEFARRVLSRLSDMIAN
ncbi:hypothetical protein WJ96_04640 [Burkholderia ubonensis]|uniref:DUF5615 domain-containing protein n=1 Tax=Burkholderia ubonensis TaxID=101571 RepID=A0AAW3MSE1_9BURK|nr:hypothetical protein [Burkholderia ubonensis]KVP65660.1 hypothetical protein WJ93_24375 [Burkholderia ubonensis]KVP97861.1 hypothetical protein WJ96_04640 [Burkholderia ubonensis]KVZ92558.1 hypothetical protein WL25_16295 [Burkholderia ubonensis]